MNSSGIGLMSSHGNAPSAIGIFETNKQMQKGSEEKHIPKPRKTWARSQPMAATAGEIRAGKELLATLFTGEDVDGQACAEQLVEEEITCRDLASLSHQDLELLGIKERQRREELLASFQNLPNQDPSYESILRLPEAQTYSREIVHKASDHLDAMRSALTAANYKLQINPPDDVLVGEKSFASRFVLEALRELGGASDNIEAELEEVEKLLEQANKKASDRPKSASPGWSTGEKMALTAALGLALAGGAYCYWKYNK